MTLQEYEHRLLQMRTQMLRIAWDFFQNREDAEDVVQEVYVCMLERGCQHDDDVEALCIKATKNLCVSVWRRQRLRETEQLDKARNEMCNETADTLLLRVEQQTMIDQAIQQLPASEQKVVRLRLQEMSTKEIAQQTGIQSRSISTMLWSARKKLHQIFSNRNDRKRTDTSSR